MSAPVLAAAPVANATAKKLKGVSCRTLNNKGKEAGEPVLFNVRPRSANSAAAPMVATNATAPAKAATKAEVDPIIGAIDAAATTVTKENLAEFNALLERYLGIMPGAAGVKAISTDIAPEALDTAVKTVVAAVKASAPKAGGGRRKTHRKKHGMRSKRHSKTHKKHGKRSTKHHKKHGKRSMKRSRKHRRM